MLIVLLKALLKPSKCVPIFNSIDIITESRLLDYSHHGYRTTCARFAKQVELTGVVKVEFIGAVSKGLGKVKSWLKWARRAEAGVVAFSDDGHYVESAAFMAA